MQIWIYFILTLILELPLVCLFYKSDWKNALIVGFLLNLFTWPLLHVLLYKTNADLNILEAGVALAEGAGYIIFMKGKWYKAMLVSFLVNGFSYGAGLLMNNLI